MGVNTLFSCCELLWVLQSLSVQHTHDGMMDLVFTNCEVSDLTKSRDVWGSIPLNKDWCCCCSLVMSSWCFGIFRVLFFEPSFFSFTHWMFPGPKLYGTIAGLERTLSNCSFFALLAGGKFKSIAVCHCLLTSCTLSGLVDFDVFMLIRHVNPLILENPMN